MINKVPWIPTRINHADAARNLGLGNALVIPDDIIR